MSAPTFIQPAALALPTRVPSWHTDRIVAKDYTADRRIQAVVVRSDHWDHYRAETWQDGDIIAWRVFRGRKAAVRCIERTVAAAAAAQPEGAGQ